MSLSFTARLADIPVGIRCLYPQTRAFLSAYLTGEAPAFTVTVEETDIREEEKKSQQEDLAEGIPLRSFPDSYLETLALYRKIAVEMLAYDVLLIHGSAVAVDGRAYLFCARSGTGKSTHTRLWRERFGTRALMVNDDKPLVRLTPDSAVVYGTPWDGKHHLSTPVAVPLDALCILTRAEENTVTPLTSSVMFPLIYAQTYRPGDPAAMAKTLELLSRLLTLCPAYRLGCNMNPDAARVAYEGMKKK